MAFKAMDQFIAMDHFIWPVLSDSSPEPKARR